MTANINKILDIKYSCRWKYKIIDTNIDNLIRAAEEIVRGFDYEIT